MIMEIFCKKACLLIAVNYQQTSINIYKMLWNGLNNNVNKKQMKIKFYKKKLCNYSYKRREYKINLLIIQS
jgi:hypothetical protein